jgi:hypothetical protein
MFACLNQTLLITYIYEGWHANVGNQIRQLKKFNFLTQLSLEIVIIEILFTDELPQSKLVKLIIPTQGRIQRSLRNLEAASSRVKRQFDYGDYE